MGTPLLAQGLSFEVEASGLEGVFLRHELFRGKLDAVPDLLSLHHSHLLSREIWVCLEGASLPRN